VARRTESGAGKAVKFAANDVAEGVAGKSVKREKNDVGKHDERTEADAKFAVEAKGLEGVVPKEAEKKDSEIEEIAMNVLEDEGKSAFTRVIFAEARFADGTGGRVEKKGPVVSFAVVVAGRAETEWPAENKNCG